MPTWVPLTRPGLPATAAGPLPVLNLYAVEGGDSPAVAQSLDRWRSAGFWPYTIARVVHTLGLDASSALKSSVVLAMLLLGVGCVGWGWRLLGWQGSMAVALLVMYASPLLSAVYQRGEVALPWALAGLSWAAWGLMTAGGWSLLLIVLGLLMAWNALPGLGLWISLALFLLALSLKNKRGVITVVLGTLVSVFPTALWARPQLPLPVAQGIRLHQLLEPAWIWQTTHLERLTPVSASLGVPLLGLLLIGWWGDRSQGTADAQPARSEGAVSDGDLKWAWLGHLAVGGILLALSLQFVSRYLTGLMITVRTPWHFLLLSLPFLAMAAMLGFRRLIAALPLPLSTALFLLIVLSAGPALSPTFETYDIPPAPAAIFGDEQIMLLQTKSVGSLMPGSSLALEVEWLALQKPDFDYNIFVHVIDAQGNKIAQLDTQPRQGERPMTSWLPGEVIPDRYEIAIPADAPTDLHVYLGLYNWQSGARLPVGNQDHLEVPVP